MFEATDGGLSSVTLRGNIYRAFPLPHPVNVTRATLLEFDFHMEEEARIHAICLEEDLTDSANANLRR